MTKSQRPADALRFDAAGQRLWRGTDRIAAPPKGLRVLRCLVENAGRVVDRHQLLADAWPGVSVTADAVRYTVRQLRLALEDSADAPRFIETVPRRGWRFVGSVERLGPEEWFVYARDSAMQSSEAPLE